MLNGTKKRSALRIKSLIGAASVALALASPASAMEIGDLFGWLVADGGDGGSGQANAPAETMVIETSFLPDALPPVAEETPADAFLPGEGMTIEIVEIIELPGDDQIYVDVIEIPKHDGAAPVPEPSAALLFGVGAFAISQRMRRR